MPSGTCEVTGKFYASLDEHHVVPQEVGGVNGPKVKLGPDVHQIIHRSVTNKQTRELFLSSLSSHQRMKAEYLIQAIIASKTMLPKVKKNEIKLEVDDKTYQQYLDWKATKK